MTSRTALHDLGVAQLATELRERRVSAVDAAQHFLAQAKDVLRVGLHELAGGGQHHPAPFAVEQRLADALLQLANLRRHRRLRGVELFGRSGQVL